MPGLEEVLPDGHPFAQPLVNADPPEHTRLRRFAQQAFTPRAVTEYEPEARAFRPHATVARLRPDARASRDPVAPPSPVTFYGEALTLYESRLRRGWNVTRRLATRRTASPTEASQASVCPRPSCA